LSRRRTDPGHPGRVPQSPAMFFTIPTLLTWARIIAIPLIVGVFYLPLDVAGRART
jgi:cardiolipin synthase